LASSKRIVVTLPTFTRNTAVKEIQRLAQEETERVHVLDHAHMRMIEREITLRQVLKVLRHGDLVTGPEWSTEGEEGWKCNFRRITAGESIEVVAKLIERDGVRCLIVTAYRR